MDEERQEIILTNNKREYNMPYPINEYVVKGAIFGSLGLAAANYFAQKSITGTIPSTNIIHEITGHLSDLSLPAAGVSAALYLTRNTNKKAQILASSIVPLAAIVNEIRSNAIGIYDPISYLIYDFSSGRGAFYDTYDMACHLIGSALAFYGITKLSPIVNQGKKGFFHYINPLSFFANKKEKSIGKKLKYSKSLEDLLINPFY